MIVLLISVCPQAAALTAIPAVTCFEDFGQVQRVLIQRMVSTGTTLNTIPIANVPTLATWTALKAAVAGTKVVVSPILGDPNIEPGEARTFGSGNAVPGGIALTLGTNFTSAKCVIYTVTQDIIRAMKLLQTERVGVFLVNASGQIAGNGDADTVTTLAPFETKSMFVGDKKIGGFEGVDTNVFSWSFPGNWSDRFHVVTPNFNPLLEL